MGALTTPVEGSVTNLLGSIAANQVMSFLGDDVSATTGATEELTIPVGSQRAILSCLPSSQAHVAMNGDATTGSPLYLVDTFGPLVMDLGGVTKLSVYVVAGSIGATFYGQST